MLVLEGDKIKIGSGGLEGNPSWFKEVDEILKE